MKPILKINGVEIFPGQQISMDIKVAQMYDATQMRIPVHVISGEEEGPNIFVCAAVHGDEINGVEIIRRIIHSLNPRQIRGCLIAIPVVNVFGFNTHSRYLPDRRDLNRCFPGSPTGSLASQMAHLLLEEIIKKCQYGIDLHTGGLHRSNLPQIRANLKDAQAKKMALHFGVPVVVDAKIRDGSMREAASEHNIPVIVYEAGEALRFDEEYIRTGVRGIFSTMEKLGMMVKKNSPKTKKEQPAKPPILTFSSGWIRAPHSGLLSIQGKLGRQIEEGELLGTISSPLGDYNHQVRASTAGVIIGRATMPLVNQGDAIFHIASIDKKSKTGEPIENYGDYQDLEQT